MGGGVSRFVLSMLTGSLIISYSLADGIKIDGKSVYGIYQKDIEGGGLDTIIELNQFSMGYKQRVLLDAFNVFIMDRDLSSIKHFLKRYPGFDINQSDALGMTPIMYSIKADDYKIFKFLLKRGASIDVFSKNGITPLRLAVSVGSHKFLKSLVKLGASLNIQDSYGKTPFMVAIATRDPRLTKAFINNIPRIDINLQDKDGKTLLILGSETGSESLVKALLKANADVFIVDKNNRDALYYARKNGNKQIIDSIEKVVGKTKETNPRVGHWIADY